MPSDFVRYRPRSRPSIRISTSYMTQIIDFWEKKVRESPIAEGSGRAVRGAHAKTHRRRQGRSRDPAHDAAGLCAGHLCETRPPRRADPVLQRLQPLGAGRHARDPFWGSRSRSSMSTDRSWSRTSRTRPPSTSCSRTTRPSSPIRRSTICSSRRSATTSAEYLRAARPGFHELLTDFLTGKGTLEQSDWAWDELFAFVKAAQTPVRNPLLTTYWSMAAVRHGDYVAKVRLAPATENTAHVIHRELDLRSGPDVFCPTLVDELQASAFDFDLQVQLCTDLDAMPVNDTTVEWPEAVSLCDGWTGAPPAPGHLGDRECREDGCARVQPVAGHRGAQAAGRDHGGATDLQRVSQGPPDAQSPAADRAHQCR